MVSRSGGSMRVFYFLGFSIFLSLSVYAGKIEHATERITATQAKTVEIDAELGAGQFNITAGNISELAMIDIEYDKRTVKYYVDYYEKGETGFLSLESDRKNNVNFDGNENRWDIVLSDKFESKLDLNIGACDAKIDFGGLPLKYLSIEIGAASGLIEFSKPNPVRLEEFRMNAGASSLDMEMLGNANFDNFNFSGGVGSFDLDFRGEYHGESEITIEIGLGSAEITLPADVPIRVISDDENWLSSVEFHGDELDEIDDGEYESEGFASAKSRIILKLEVGLGSADLYWKD
jgi:hypothetical protein